MGVDAAIEVVPADVAWQASLFGGVGSVGHDTGPAVDASFSTATRCALDDDSWIDVVPGWMLGADDLFATLLGQARWLAHDRVMYGQVVAQPRLTAGWRDARVRRAAPVLEQARRALSERYARHFDSGGINLYRDGRDSVAWHRDRIPKHIDRPVVAILTLGSARRFLVRPYRGGASIRFEPAPGDLLVTGGMMQRQWEHAVPKSASATGPRISVTFRHTD